jgi:hypothetical protein
VEEASAAVDLDPNATGAEKSAISLVLAQRSATKAGDTEEEEEEEEDSTVQKLGTCGTALYAVDWRDVDCAGTPATLAEVSAIYLGTVSKDKNATIATLLSVISTLSRELD